MALNIKDLSPYLAGSFVEFEIDDEIIRRYDNYFKRYSKRLGHFSKYVGRLHDSWILKTEITDNAFSITLNDFTTHVFSDVIVDRKNLTVEHDKLVFPIQLDFEFSKLTFNKVEESGDIIEIKPTKVNEYLDDQIISVKKDLIEIALVVWKDGTKNKRGQHILILMTVKNISVTDLKDKAWAEIFGNAYDNYYHYFKSQLDSGRFLSGQSLCYELYDEYEEQHNKE